MIFNEPDVYAVLLNGLNVSSVTKLERNVHHSASFKTIALHRSVNYQQAIPNYVNHPGHLTFQ